MPRENKYRNSTKHKRQSKSDSSSGKDTPVKKKKSPSSPNIPNQVEGTIMSE